MPRKLPPIILRAEVVAKALDPDHAKFEAGEWRIRCIAPGHADRTPSLDLTNDAATGHLLACCRTQCGGEVFPHLFDRLVHLGLVPPPFEKQPLWRLAWDHSKPLLGSAGERYFAGRNLPTQSSPDVRYHPSCVRGAKPNQQQLPAIIYLLRSADDEPVAVSRVFLNGQWRKDGKPMSLSSTKGTAFRLSREVGSTLYVCEGPEDAVALLADGVSPVWATCSEAQMKGLPVVAGVETLVLVPDKDDAGRKAAAACAKRWSKAGKAVHIILVPGDAKDAAEHVARRADGELMPILREYLDAEIARRQASGAADEATEVSLVIRLRRMLDAPEGWDSGGVPPDEVPFGVLERMALAIFNPCFAIAKIGPKLFVFDKRKPKIDLLQPHDFHQRYAGIAVVATWYDEQGHEQRRPMALSKAWFKAPGASTIERFVFEPPGPPGFVAPRVWNTSSGFVEAEPGPTPEFDRVLEAMLGEADREYVLDWFADVVQDPLNPPGTILGLVGRSQAGKSLLASYLGAMFDALYSGALHCSALTGRFNAHLEHVLLLHLDEVSEDQTRAFRAIFRLIATGADIMIEAKGVNKIRMRNPIHLLVTSEEDPFALIDAGDVEAGCPATPERIAYLLSIHQKTS